VPEATFTVRWPDGAVEDCYSPSLVVHDHLVPGDRYPVADFERRVVEAMRIASDRVRARYGSPCGRAAATAALVRARCADLPADAAVEVVAIRPPLPSTPIGSPR
jgi:uncharacterized repeat protein (TIGR04042 family)